MLGRLQPLGDSLVLISICELLAEPAEYLAALLTCRVMALFARRYAKNVAFPLFAELMTLAAEDGRAAELPQPCRRHVVVRFADQFAQRAELVFPRLAVVPETVALFNTTTDEYDSDGRREVFRFDRMSLGLHVQPLAALRPLRRLCVSNFPGVLQTVHDTADANPDCGLAQLAELVLSMCDVTAASLARYCASPTAARRVVVYGDVATTPALRESVLAARSGATGRCTSLVVDAVDATALQTLLQQPLCAVSRLRALRLALRGPSEWERIRLPCLVDLELTLGGQLGASKAVSMDLNFAECPALASCYVSGCPSITAIAGGAACQLRCLRLVACVIHFRGSALIPECDVVLEGCVGSSTRIELVCRSIRASNHTGTRIVFSPCVKGSS
jgi:hypothetical protein